MKKYYIDFETSSIYDLRKVGSKFYIEAPETKIISAVLIDAENKDNIIIYLPDAPKPVYNMYPSAVKVFPKIDRKDILIAHNAFGFDKPLAESKLNIKCNWKDTIHYIAQCNLPMSLDKALTYIGSEGKKDNKALKLLTNAKFIGGRAVYPKGTASLWKNLIDYNLRDVTGMFDLMEFCKRLDQINEDHIIKVHNYINQVGFKIDVNRLNALIKLWKELKEYAYQKIEELTAGKIKGDAIRSHIKVKDYLKSIGINTDTINQQVLKKMQLSAHAKELLEYRSYAVANPIGKLVTAKRIMNKQNVIQNSYLYHKQHTGRFSGKGFQPTNMVRYDKDAHLNPITFENLLTVSKRNEGNKKGFTLGQIIGKNTRTVITARKNYKLMVADYTAIEARKVAWFSNCAELLELYYNDADVYCNFGGRLFGREIIKGVDKDERQISKQVILGSGYGMGAVRFTAIAETEGIDLDAVGLTAEYVIQLYRNTYKEIPLFWRELSKHFIHAANNIGSIKRLGKVTFTSMKIGNNLIVIIILPSGRKIYYHNVQLISTMALGRNGKKFKATQIMFNKQGIPDKTFGGKLAENICSSSARDILVNALYNLYNIRKELDIKIVGTVHDEIILEIPDTKNINEIAKKCNEAMILKPNWAETFPLASEYAIDSHYTK